LLHLKDLEIIIEKTLSNRTPCIPENLSGKLLTSTVVHTGCRFCTTYRKSLRLARGL